MVSIINLFKNLKRAATSNPKDEDPDKPTKINTRLGAAINNYEALSISIELIRKMQKSDLGETNNKRWIKELNAEAIAYRGLIESELKKLLHTDDRKTKTQDRNYETRPENEKA